MIGTNHQIDGVSARIREIDIGHHTTCRRVIVASVVHGNAGGRQDLCGRFELLKSFDGKPQCVIKRVPGEVADIVVPIVAAQINRAILTSDLLEPDDRSGKFDGCVEISRAQTTVADTNDVDHGRGQLLVPIRQLRSCPECLDPGVIPRHRRTRP